MTESPALLVLGGTGAVGTHVSTLLAERAHRVLVGSRHLDAATRTADRIPGAEGRRVDILDPTTIGDRPGVAVNCTGVESVDAIGRWREAGWRVIDITASSQYATRLAELDPDGADVVVGVGLVPGLTSVLARQLVENDNGATESVTVSCLLGLGEDYGDASRDWTYDQLGRRVHDATGDFRNFSAPEPIEFGGGFGQRTTWRFDFADRVLLPPELGVNVTTRYCFDSRVAGRTLAVASALPPVAAALRRANRFSRRSIGGTAWWAGVVETNTRARAIALGNGQSFGTAAVAAIAASRLADPSTGPARYLWDLVSADDLRTELADVGVLVAVE